MIKKELLFFLIIGITTVVIDLFIYSCFLWAEIGTINFAKGMGFLFGTIFSYFSNKNITFGHQSYKTGSFKRFIAVYGVSLMVNIYINSLFIGMFSEYSHVFQISFFIATFFSATTNFLGMKFFVFR